MKPKHYSICIIINSLIYFLLAYYSVAWLINMVIVALAKYYFGFEVTLLYNGLNLISEKPEDNNIIIVYFWGNIFSFFAKIE